MKKIFFILILFNTFLFSFQYQGESAKYKYYVDFEELKNKKSPDKFLLNKDLLECNKLINDKGLNVKTFILEIGMSNKKFTHFAITTLRDAVIDDNIIKYSLCIKNVLVNDEDFINSFSLQKTKKMFALDYRY